MDSIWRYHSAIYVFLLYVLVYFQFAHHLLHWLLASIIIDWPSNLLVIVTCNDSQVSPNAFLAKTLQAIEHALVVGLDNQTVRNVNIQSIAVQEALWVATQFVMHEQFWSCQNSSTIDETGFATLWHDNLLLVIEFISFLQEADLRSYQPFPKSLISNNSDALRCRALELGLSWRCWWVFVQKTLWFLGGKAVPAVVGRTSHCRLHGPFNWCCWVMSSELLIYLALVRNWYTVDCSLTTRRKSPPPWRVCSQYWVTTMSWICI